MTQPGQQQPAAADPQMRWSGRLPHLTPAELDPAQRAFYDRLQAGPLPWAAQQGFLAQDDQGRLIGPFNIFLHSPQISSSYNDLIGVEMSQTELSAPVREIVILTVGAQWHADYEIYAHTAVARAAGLSDTVIAAVLSSDTTDSLTEQQAAAHAFTRQLVRDRRVDDAAYARAESLFGAKGLVDMVHLIGFYLTTSALLNAFKIPAPPLPAPSGTEVDPLRPQPAGRQQR